MVDGLDWDLTPDKYKFTLQNKMDQIVSLS